MFLLHPHENQSIIIGYQGWVKILMITLVYSPKQPFYTILHTTVGLRSFSQVGNSTEAYISADE
jgi:hypothetical protein